MIVLVVTADMGREQPRHVVAEITVCAWPNDKVKVVGHQAVSNQAHGHVLVGVAQEIEEGVEIAILVKDGTSAITAVKDVVTVAAKRNSQGTWHRRHNSTHERKSNRKVR